MNKAIIIFAVIAYFAPSMRAVSLEFEGTDHKVIVLDCESSTGLDKLYVLYNLDGVNAIFPSPSAKWSKFSSAGAAYADPVVSTIQGNSSIADLSGMQGGGLLIEDGGRQYCYWIIDYSQETMQIADITASTDNFDCDFLSFRFTGIAAPIYYFSINGRRLSLSRDIEISYNTLVFNETEYRYEQSEHTVLLPSLSPENHVAAPLCDTRVSVCGDRFLKEWGEEQYAETGLYKAVAVKAFTKAAQTTESADNEQKPGGTELGGSAPCEIEFTAEPTDAVVFSEWQISRNADFDILENSYNDLNIAPVFTENGTFFVRYTAANADGTCTYTSDTYEISIGESKLTCPNAFTPDTSPGVNDEWKVSYQSIVEFKCEIFNRWGTKLATLTHPSQGWDGKYGGKSVGPGVYYYVLNARGADGKNYRLSGDINIVGSRERGNYSAD